MKKRRINNLYISLFLLFILSGCGLWTDVTTYFNSYYNAVTLFDEAEQTVLLQERNLFAFQEPKINSTTNTQLLKVIEKCSAILQYKSESAYFDDALLMIGKSFYYQQEYQKAVRKFRELEAANPDSDLNLENSLWILKSEFRARNFDIALTEFENLKNLAIQQDRTDILSEAYIQKISYLLNQEDYENAILDANELLKISDNDELSANIMFEIGNMYLQTKNFKSAAESFQMVENYSPVPTINFNSRIQLARTQRFIDNPKEGLKILEELQDEDKFQDSLDVIKLEMGITYGKLKNYEEAIEELTEVDTTYFGKATSGLAQFEKAKLYENYIRDFDSASFYYNKVNSSKVPLIIKQEAISKNQIFSKYKKYAEEKRKLYRSLDYINFPDEFTKDSLRYATEKATQDSLAEILKQKFLEGEQTTSKRSTQTTQNQTIPQKILIPPQKPTLSADSIKALIPIKEYDLANLFFTELEMIDSAFYYYNNIITDYPTSKIFPNALFAIGSYYDLIDSTDKADSIYNFIYDNFKDNKIVNSAAIQINKEQIPFDVDSGEQLYLDAEKNIINEKYHESLTQLNNIVRDFPKSKFVPKALYTSGWIYENKLDKPDSAAVFYDSLVTKYKNTTYASAVTLKLSGFKEQIKIEAAKKDSILKAEQKLLEEVNKTDQTEDKQTEIEQGVDILKDMPLVPADSLLTPTKEVTDTLLNNRKRLLREEKAPGTIIKDSLNTKFKIDDSDSTKKKIELN